VCEVESAVKMQVESDRRQGIMANHTATHLVNWALRETLKKNSDQKGSLAESAYFRFDFAHDRPLTEGAPCAVSVSLCVFVYVCICECTCIVPLYCVCVILAVFLLTLLLTGEQSS
jgi:hypothetical protein